MTKLSSAAQTVWNAFLDRYEWTVTTEELFAVAAVLRAVRDQLAPEKTIEDISYVHQSYVDGYKDALDEILAIAIELEAQ
jgi:hypothetical protein